MHICDSPTADLELVQVLLDSGAEVNDKSKVSYTLIYII